MDTSSEKLDYVQRLLKRSERHLQAIVDGTYDGIISINSDGIIDSFNAAAATMFGYSQSEVIGENIDVIIPDEEKLEHRKYVRNAGLTGKKVISVRRQLYGRHKNGALIPVEVTINRVLCDDRVIYVGVIRDVSELTTERNNLVTALLRAESASQSKDRLLSSASHELRTPLNAILGFSQILIADHDTVSVEQRVEFLEDIYSSAKLLQLLVNDVLDYAEIDGDHVELELEPVRFDVLMKECVRIIQPEFRKKNLRYSGACIGERWVLADSLRLQQVMLNLLSNACKYNVDGGSISVVAESRGEGHYCIDIIDSGIGIREDKLPSLFQPFSRLHDLRLPIEGSGIGLSLCKNLVELMAGTIQYKKNSAAGSTFTVCLPLTDKFPVDGEDWSSSNEKGKPNSHCRVLYVEDNAVNIRLMEAVMKRSNMHLDSVTSAESALDFLCLQRPDIILMDINLPGMSGREATRKIQNIPGYSDIPIVAVSASPVESDARSKNLFFDFVSKPFRTEQIQSVMERALAHREGSESVDPVKSPLKIFTD